jgi:hypothetical protein
MTEIRVDREDMESSFGRVVEQLDAIDRALAHIPTAPDGGIATELIAFTMAAALESAGTEADSYRVLIAIARDVLADLKATDESAAAELLELEQQIEEG